MSENPWTLRSEDIEALQLGAQILGSGGGGTTWEVSLAVRELLAENGPVTVFPNSYMSADDLAIPVGLVGSVVAYTEKPSDALPFVEAFDAIRLDTQTPFVCSYETAGMNTFAGVLVAASAGVPLVDVDGMGRAFPGLHQTSFRLGGVKITPCSIVSSAGRRIDILGHTPEEAEEVIRTLMRTAGGWAAFAGYSMTGTDIRRAGIPGSLRRALDLGTGLTSALKSRGNARDAIEVFARETTSASLIAHGRIVEVTWRNAHDKQHIERRAGSIVVESAADGRFLRIEAQSEYLLLMEAGEVLAATPDIIDVLDARTGTPIVAEALLPGFAVCVITVKAPQTWHSSGAGALVGPSAFGYSLTQEGPSSDDDSEHP